LISDKRNQKGGKMIGILGILFLLMADSTTIKTKNVKVNEPVKIDLSSIVFQVHPNPVEIKVIEKRFASDSIQMKRAINNYQEYLTSTGLINLFTFLYMRHPEILDSILTQTGATLFDAKGRPISGVFFKPEVQKNKK
jgi:hypothetical protein